MDQDPLPCETIDSPIMKLKEQYDAAESQEQRDSILLEILDQHPFVKRSTEPSEFDRPQHSFQCYGYILNVRYFQKWIKTKEGAPFKKRGGGVSDDALFTISPLLRELVPRGLHIVVATQKETRTETRFWFRGIPKFTGIASADEDEESNSHEVSNYSAGDSMVTVRLQGL